MAVYIFIYFLPSKERKNQIFIKYLCFILKSCEMRLSVFPFSDCIISRVNMKKTLKSNFRKHLNMKVKLQLQSAIKTKHSIQMNWIWINYIIDAGRRCLLLSVGSVITEWGFPNSIALQSGMQVSLWHQVQVREWLGGEKTKHNIDAL